ncbi:hypothetical protein B0H19DRAFT_1154943 [Mycena capillaripes]|nr:hypothetical protein B0H19DRAFT_1154943 [Mycena capillaripes]
MFSQSQTVNIYGGVGGDGGRGGEQGGGGAVTMNLTINHRLNDGHRRAPVEAGCSEEARRELSRITRNRRHEIGARRTPYDLSSRLLGFDEHPSFSRQSMVAPHTFSHSTLQFDRTGTSHSRSFGSANRRLPPSDVPQFPYPVSYHPINQADLAVNESLPTFAR